VRHAVDDERRHGRRAVGQPPLALLADHDGVEVETVRTKELLGQPADRSARVGVEDELTFRHDDDHNELSSTRARRRSGVAWDFSTEPEFEEQLEWIRAFVRDEIWPIETI